MRDEKNNLERIAVDRTAEDDLRLATALERAGDHTGAREAYREILLHTPRESPTYPRARDRWIACGGPWIENDPPKKKDIIRLYNVRYRRKRNAEPRQVHFDIYSRPVFFDILSFSDICFILDLRARDMHSMSLEEACCAREACRALLPIQRKEAGTVQYLLKTAMVSFIHSCDDMPCKICRSEEFADEFKAFKEREGVSRGFEPDFYRGEEIYVRRVPEVFSPSATK